MGTWVGESEEGGDQSSRGSSGPGVVLQIDERKRNQLKVTNKEKRERICEMGQEDRSRRTSKGIRSLD
jgi:hypothetical protein